MQTGKLINGISNRLRRRSQVVQKRIGISGAQGNVLDYILVESENHPVYQTEIEKEFGDEIDYLFEKEVKSSNVSSTVIDCTSEDIKVLRQGEIIIK